MIVRIQFNDGTGDKSVPGVTSWKTHKKFFEYRTPGTITFIPLSRIKQFSIDTNPGQQLAYCPEL
jgi:hypothetical protein